MGLMVKYSNAINRIITIFCTPYYKMPNQADKLGLLSSILFSVIIMHASLNVDSAMENHKMHDNDYTRKLRP